MLYKDLFEYLNQEHGLTILECDAFEIERIVLKNQDDKQLQLAAVSGSLLERAASLVGNPGTNISGSTDFACAEWQKDYKRWRNER